MTRRLFAGAALAPLFASAAAPRVSRADLRSLEKNFDNRINQAVPEDPLDLLGNTRGIYLEGYGVVLSAEVGLVIAPAPTPFAPTQTREAKERLRQRKLARAPLLRKLMRDMLVTTATNLRGVPMNEQVVVGVTLFYQSWEDTSGLPGQILVQAQRKALADLEAGRVKPEALASIIQEQVL